MRQMRNGRRERDDLRRAAVALIAALDLDLRSDFTVDRSALALLSSQLLAGAAVRELSLPCNATHTYDEKRIIL